MSRGHAVRAELAPEARRLRAEGLLLREISERLGLPKSTVHEWISDPDRAKHAARRAKYAGACVECGVPTDGSHGPGQAPDRCGSCYIAFVRKCSRLWIVDSIQRWADEHGGIPPSATDWNVFGQRGHKDGDWPHTSRVLRQFGSWNAAIEAAGFESKPVGCYGRPGEDPELCAEIRLAYETGQSTLALARQYSCAAKTITYRVRKAGGVLRSRTEAQALRRLMAA